MTTKSLVGVYIIIKPYTLIQKWTQESYDELLPSNPDGLCGL